MTSCISLSKQGLPERQVRLARYGVTRKSWSRRDREKTIFTAATITTNSGACTHMDSDRHAKLMIQRRYLGQEGINFTGPGIETVTKRNTRYRQSPRFCRG
ncbi:hypothetical protein MPTK1_6g18290 [Marchantia polymorpha subsp. ruderalis]|uniref:Uncharacterized protein n=2 Tax=Marchantia polymorpha TaxID=3197 RepID=A0AAF6BTB7_MARPO|nr:hypothetical protein MARPO_0038s0039 [Marchantia polymorpha]BBN15251.1 hypothetical protein Mp_6g18290 [Marchantia polymorpha subsp. ruderalis]|eukprot:PTQ40684.1 hypothetical protein MARPO_0038s0039 [Marchantia polymorpha]